MSNAPARLRTSCSAYSGCESIPHTQEGLAAALGIDRGTVQGWESGRRPFTAVSLGQSVAVRHRLAALGAADGAAADQRREDHVLEGLAIAQGVPGPFVGHAVELLPELLGLLAVVGRGRELCQPQEHSEGQGQD